MTQGLVSDGHSLSPISHLESEGDSWTTLKCQMTLKSSPISTQFYKGKQTQMCEAI